ncbi:MAG: DMT family transporter [Clostridia bacterium]|nr:DMT family transporter [Clostridia bacterium]
MKKIISPLILLSAAFIWGIAFVAQKAASEVSLFTLCASRSIVAVIALIPVVMIFDRVGGNKRKLFSKKGIDLSKKELIGGLLAGVFLFIATALQQAGINNTDAGKASFITALYVVIVPIFALVFGKRSPINAWVGVGIAVVGFYLLCIKEGFTVATPDLLVFACAFVFAMQILTIDKFIEGSDGVRLSLVQFTTVSILSLASALIFETPIDFSKIGAALPEILFLGIGSSCIAYTLQIIGQKNTEPAVASIILSLESVFGAVASAIILGEVMLPKEYFGCALVLLSVIISQLDFSAIAKKLGIEKKNGSPSEKQ